VVLGIGINLQPVQVHDAAYPVTSLAQHGVVASPDAVVRILAQDLAHRLKQWRERGFAPISDAWGVAGPRVSETVTVRLPGADSPVVQGHFRALDDDGALLVDLGGTIKRILAGEVLFQRPDAARTGAA
jgi:BirA family biotin operon repressor/biotin-[acetyl-CoA-carboxylase] ligase